MIKIGEYNKLRVSRIKDFGYYLASKSGEEILLPKALALGKEIEVGDYLEVFAYNDSNDRPVSTLKKPLVTAYEVGYLEIVGNSSFGAFANIGLERDILVPLKEQKFKLLKDHKYLLYVYVDKTGRLAATTEIDNYIDLAEEGRYNVGDSVKAISYDLGGSGRSIKVAIDGKYRGLILGNEYFNSIYPGEELDLRVKRIYEDGTIGVTPRHTRLDEREVLKNKIIEYLKSNGGKMIYNDKSNPEEIKEVFNTSKNYFKMALGGLMKEGKITQDKEGTYLK